MKTVWPTEDRIYVLRRGSWDEYQDHGGLAVVEDKPMLEVGEVLAVGPGQAQYTPKPRQRILVPMEVKQGDLVLFNRYAGTDVEAGLDEKHVFLEPREVLAVIVEK